MLDVALGNGRKWNEDEKYRKSEQCMEKVWQCLEACGKGLGRWRGVEETGWGRAGSSSSYLYPSM
jgi:hypothetical protein